MEDNKSSRLLFVWDGGGGIVVLSSSSAFLIRVNDSCMGDRAFVFECVGDEYNASVCFRVSSEYAWLSTKCVFVSGVVLSGNLVSFFKVDLTRGSCLVSLYLFGRIGNGALVLSRNLVLCTVVTSKLLSLS